MKIKLFEKEGIAREMFAARVMHVVLDATMHAPAAPASTLPSSGRMALKDKVFVAFGDALIFPYDRDDE